MKTKKRFWISPEDSQKDFHDKKRLPARLIQKLILFLIFTLISPVLAVAELDLSELKDKEKQTTWRIESLQKDLSEQSQEVNALSDEALGIESNIQRISEELRANEEKIVELSTMLAEREAALSGTKERMAILIRELEAEEKTSQLAKLLNHDNLSDAMLDTDRKRAVAEQIAIRYGEMNEHTEVLEAARDQLEFAKIALASSRITLDFQHQALKAEEAQKQALLDSSRSHIQAAEAERAEIRKQLFTAAFDNTGKAINIEQAIGYAKLAAERLKQETGQEISVPFILALVKQESNFGNFLGKGYYKSSMCSQSQIEAFVYITTSLGLDPETTPVSKPAKHQSCGGAMGYAQFLPRTWLSYVDKVAKLTGHNPPSPWNPEDAFMAVALKLAANGATNGSTASEKRRAQWEAAMTYFSGSNWKKNGAKNIGWYADRILEAAAGYAVVIDD